MCLFIILGTLGGSQQEGEGKAGTGEREWGERDSTAAAEISGSAGQQIELLSWSGGTLSGDVYGMSVCLFVIPCKGSLYLCGDV